MPSTFIPTNPALYDAVRSYYRHCVQGFVDAHRDLNSSQFLAEFPFIFIPGQDGQQSTDDDDEVARRCGAQRGSCVWVGRRY